MVSCQLLYFPGVTLTRSALPPPGPASIVSITLPANDNGLPTKASALCCSSRYIWWLVAEASSAIANPPDSNSRAADAARDALAHAIEGCCLGDPSKSAISVRCRPALPVIHCIIHSVIAATDVAIQPTSRKRLRAPFGLLWRRANQPGSDRAQQGDRVRSAVALCDP